MTETKKGCGCSLPCAVTAIILFVLAVMILLPAVQPSREAARRLTCQTKIKDIVLACNLHEGKYRRLPPSCHEKSYVTADGAIAYNKDGYSFLADALPEMEQEALYKRLNINAPLDEQGDVPDEIIGTQLYMYFCPSAGMYARDGEPLPPFALTNYKAVSGTTRRAYELSSRTDTPSEWLDIYGTGALRTESDGVMYPGSRTTLADITDGAANTLLITESVEPAFARWLVGQECGLYTMRDDAKIAAATDAVPYVQPVADPPPVKKKRWGAKETPPQTNLNRDYVQSPYPWGESGFVSTRYALPPTGTRLGPGSAHKGITMHGYVDGQAVAIPDEIDAAAYFFLTTRAGSDPEPPDDTLRGW